jgi:hypothetical protein
VKSETLEFKEKIKKLENKRDELIELYNKKNNEIGMKDSEI